MRFQKLAVATCAMGTLTVNMNNTALNLALPRIRDDLGLNLATMQWVSATYVLVLAALTMLGGALGDRYSKRTVLTVELLVYILGSVLGIMADSGIWLALSRVCAAIGASVLVPVVLATLRVIAQTPKQLASYMSLWGLAVGLGMAHWDQLRAESSPAFWGGVHSSPLWPVSASFTFVPFSHSCPDCRALPDAGSTSYPTSYWAAACSHSPHFLSRCVPTPQFG